MSSFISDDDYSTSSYYSSTAARCNQYNKVLVDNLVAEHQEPVPQRKKRFSLFSSSKISNVFRCLLMPCQYPRRHHNRNKSLKAEEKYCSCDIPCKPSESITFIDHQQQEQLWIVPSKYHQNILSSSPSAASQNQWIFRTGWTPQPDPLAFITSGWCNHCGSCVKKDLNQCPSCSIEPLVTTRQQQRLFGIEENGSGEKRKRTGPN